MGKSKDLATSSLSSDLTVDTNTFHVDVADNRVGIGTTTPTNNLTIIDGGATPYGADDTVLLDIKRNTANTGATNAVGFRLANNSNGFNIKYGGASDTLNISGGSGNTVATFRNDGGLTLPYQPAFAVYKTATTGSGSTITHNGSWSNVGNHYSSSTGRFTCPVAGTYFFYCTGLTQPNGNVSRLTLALNGSNRASQSRNENISGDYLHIVTMGVMTVSAGDYVTSYYANDDGGTNLYSDTSPYITFGGYLIG